MAKEEDVKKIELKVSVNCCDGCKKKVLKALSIKGVLKTDIHPTLPKVTVTGNVDANLLVKKLAKCGKVAEIIIAETKKQEAGERKSESVETCTKEKVKDKNCNKKPVCEQAKYTNHGNANKSNKVENNGDGEKLDMGPKASESINNEVIKTVNPTTTTTTTVAAATITALPNLSYIINPNMMQEAVLPQISQPRVYCSMEPYMVPVTYYTATAYPAPPLVQPPHYMQEHFNHEAPPVYHQHPTVQPLPPRLTDYFNDDNTVGCNVM